MTAAPRTRRVLLFAPADQRRKVEKAAALGADGIILDLEDAVAQDRKAEAREAARAALAELDFGPRERLVRINPAQTALAADDLRATLPARPDAYVLPKAESAADIERLHQQLAELEREHGLPEGALPFLAIIESARGVVNLAEIAAAPRVQALIFGAEDLCGDIGARRTPEGREVAFAASAVVIHAAARGLQAIDTPFVDLRDAAGLATAARAAADAGFTGKLAIHPAQIQPILEAFTPTPDELAAARRLIAAHDAHQRAGTGVFELDGRMVDMPMVRAAERVLARARRAGLVAPEA